MSGERVRLVLNRVKANSTNTIHNVFFKRGASGLIRNATVAGFYSSLTALSTELIGRAYGGGVLKLELNEARRVLMPKITSFPPLLVEALNRALCDVDTAIRRKEDVGGIVDGLVLREGLGLSKGDVQILTDERIRLATRRMTRQQ